MKEEQTHPDIQAISASKYLIKNKGRIKALWEESIRDRIHSAEDQTSIALLNSVETFLDELATTLAQSKSNFPYIPLTKKGMSEMYGEQRANFTGYFLPQLLKEFSILREIILADFHKSKCLSYEIGVVINNAVDSAISLAATEFTAVQQINIKTALKKAETSNEDLEHFAAIAAHDLKSPLATISSYLDLLVDDMGEGLKKDALDYVNIMQKSSERMRNLIDRLLDYARLAKADKIFQAVDLNQIMKSTLQNLYESIHKNNAEIYCDSLPTVIGDSSLLTQLFQNLIANSIKFRRKEIPEIHITATIQSEVCLFSLKDNGVGFDPKNKEDIFVLYKKLASEAGLQGVGIGLATCKKVVELHGGRIWADSNPGQGSTFYFTLPLDHSYPHQEFRNQV